MVFSQVKHSILPPAEPVDTGLGTLNMCRDPGSPAKVDFQDVDLRPLSKFQINWNFEVIKIWFPWQSWNVVDEIFFPSQNLVNLCLAFSQEISVLLFRSINVHNLSEEKKDFNVFLL